MSGFFCSCLSFAFPLVASAVRLCPKTSRHTHFWASSWRQKCIKSALASKIKVTPTMSDHMCYATKVMEQMFQKWRHSSVYATNTCWHHLKIPKDHATNVMRQMFQKWRHTYPQNAVVLWWENCWRPMAGKMLTSYGGKITLVLKMLTSYGGKFTPDGGY
jgi:hypothetical protein